MDVAGVALATIISQYISAALVVWCLVREEGALRLELNKLGLQWSVIRRILQVGLPAGCQGVVFSLSNVVIQSAINSFDDPVPVSYTHLDVYKRQAQRSGCPLEKEKQRNE